MQVKRKEAIPCANQNIPLTSPNAGSAARCAPGCPTAAGASTGTSAPGTPPSPSLPDKAAGIYETLGPAELLCRLVAASERTSSTATESAALFAGFLRDGYRPTLNLVYDCAGRLTGTLGQLLAILDVILEAAEVHRLTDCGQDLRQSYQITWHNLLRQAVQQGLPDDYSAARLREERFAASGLRRPGFVEKGAQDE